MTSGDKSGTNGTRRRQVFWMIWGAVAAFMVVNNLINAVSQSTDLRRAGVHVLAWEPYVWELTSAALSIALVPLVAAILRFAPPRPGGWLRFAAVNIPATAAYCLIHVVGFFLLRHLVYLALGRHYSGSLDLAYEYPKDLRGYVFVFALLWFGDQLAAYWTKADAAKASADPATFDIRDGANLIRVRVADIVAASSAGNYVEMHLVDGRKPLLRGTLTRVDTALKPYGFVRTHRSWLVNPLRVKGMNAEGSGDFRVDLEGGGEAPLSRRFPQALEILRSPEVSA